MHDHVHHWREIHSDQRPLCRRLRLWSLGLKGSVGLCADQIWKKVNQAFDWGRAHDDLNAAEAAYEQAKASRPDKDWRTRDSGGPQMRTAIRQMKQAVDQRDEGMLKMALGELRGMMS